MRQTKCESFLNFCIEAACGGAGSPVVLPADPTLLFTMGMNQFKEVFLRRREAGEKRVANTQKCIRVSENTMI